MLKVVFMLLAIAVWTTILAMGLTLLIMIFSGIAYILDSKERTYWSGIAVMSAVALLLEFELLLALVYLSAFNLQAEHRRNHTTIPEANLFVAPGL